jgi:hypothetical protein
MKKDKFEKVEIRKEKHKSIVICPNCGYSFRKLDPKKRGKNNFCPMCRYKFTRPDLR